MGSFVSNLINPAGAIVKKISGSNDDRHIYNPGGILLDKLELPDYAAGLDPKMQSPESLEAAAANEAAAAAPAVDTGPAVPGAVPSQTVAAVTKPNQSFTSAGAKGLGAYKGKGRKRLLGD
ncbi:MAG: hypothetical protein DRP45_00915 [Candidatus Zixiibacteriota bacterium]|nr:MAG: hypothetical protein DRP45_00915 [candidate division Zixibacteria bacterium]